MLDLRESIMQSLGSNGLQFPNDETGKYSGRLGGAVVLINVCHLSPRERFQAYHCGVLMAYLATTISLSCFSA